MKRRLKFLLTDSRPTLNITCEKRNRPTCVCTWRSSFRAAPLQTRHMAPAILSAGSTSFTNYILTGVKLSPPQNRFFPVCFCNGFQSVITGSPGPWVTWFLSFNVTASATVRPVSHLRLMRCYTPKNTSVPCSLVSSLWENKMTAASRCAGQRKPSIRLTVHGYDILQLIFSRVSEAFSLLCCCIF